MYVPAGGLSNSESAIGKERGTMGMEEGALVEAPPGLFVLRGMRRRGISPDLHVNADTRF